MMIIDLSSPYYIDYGYILLGLSLALTQLAIGTCPLQVILVLPRIIKWELL